MFTLKLTRLIHEKVYYIIYVVWIFIFINIQLFVYFLGYKILYKEGCDVTISKANGTVHSPAYNGGM